MARHARGITKIERKIEDEYQGSWVDVDPPTQRKGKKQREGRKEGSGSEENGLSEDS